MFESLIMQLNSTIPPIVATIPAPATDVATTITALIVAIGGMLAAVATIVQRLGDRKELSGHKVALEEAASRLGELGQHMIASKEDIKSLAEVTYDFAPDKAKEIVNKQNIRLLELTKKLEDAQKKLEKIPPALDHI
jgi:hypothetical protein